MSDGSVGDRLVVVGAGIIGLSIAFHLVERGYDDVVVIDHGAIGEGATAAATGGIRRQFSERVNIRLAQESFPFWTTFEERTGSPLTFRRHGYLFLLSDPDHLREFGRSAALQREMGVDVEVLEPHEVSDVFPSTRTDDLLGATYTPSDGSASPADAVAGLLSAVRRRGVAVRPGVAMRSIQLDADGALSGVVTDQGPIPCHTMVIAAGPQAGVVGAACGIDVPVRPHSRQAFATTGLSMLDATMPLTVDMATGAYVHPERAGGAVIGGTDRDVGSTPTARVDRTRVEALAGAVSSRFPGLGDIEVVRGWAGLREMTPDDHAILGPAEAVPGVWVAAGFSGHGFMQAPAVGRVLADWLLDGRPTFDVSRLALDRFTDADRTRPETAVF